MANGVRSVTDHAGKVGMHQREGGQPLQPPLLLDSRRAAEALGLSERTLFSLKEAGTIPFVPVGKRGVRYDPRDLRDWIDRQKVQKCKEPA